MKERCDNCRGEFDFALTGSVFEPQSNSLEGPAWVVMDVPLDHHGTPDMGWDGPDNGHVRVRTMSDLAFCTLSCEDAWFEGRANRILLRREERRA